jgi:N-acyl amino acid synthase of PEP-CTERM/exosortase system
MNAQKVFTVAEEFSQYFRVIFASDGNLVKEAFRIRHAVYCDELGWEPRRPDLCETDSYDGHALHCLLQHRRTGEFAGCIRLVQTYDDFRVPFEEHCQEAVDTSIINPFALPRGSFGEISRLAVPARFRRRKHEQNVPYVIEFPGEHYSEEERRHFPNIAVGLYLASIACVDLLSMDYVFVMMEPRLNRHLVRFGLPFVPAGEPVDYHGHRGLFYLEKDRLTVSFPSYIRPLYELIYDSLAIPVRSTVSR